MCGIAGAVGPGVADPSIVERQLRTIEHRGPDSWGIHQGTDAACGQTRLSIIDLPGGDPPITNEDGTVGVAFNGEIYNYRELRRALIEGGHYFRTDGDTEVICHLGETCDPVDLASRLDGMFAFALWDERRGRLTLGRDRLGKKPLYYWTDGARFVFGSEIKAVLAHPAVPSRLDPEAIPTYLGFGYVPSPSTFFEGVQSVPPGHVLVFEGNGHIELRRFWEPQIPGTGQVGEVVMSLPGAAARARALLSQAVQRRLMADVPLGAFLSGGIDSSAIVALMAGLGAAPVRTFTIGFDDQTGLDERPYARLVADAFGTDHVEFVVRPDAVELMERLVWHHDQPFGDSSAIPTFLLAELTRKHVTVALSGDGGDEIFAGYERFSAALAASQFRHLPGPARAAARRAVALLPPNALAGRARSAQRFIEGAELAPAHALRSWVGSVPDQWREALLPGSSSAGVRAYEQIWKASEGARPLSRLLDINLRTYLLDDLLPKADRMSMAHGLEVRSPFLDRDLVEFALRLPPRLHLRALSRKRVLRAAMADLLPPAVLRRRKRGFAVPVDRWFRTDLAELVRARLTAPDARVKHHLNPTAVDAMVVEHMSANANHGHPLWALLTLELFLRRHDW